jgi:hypothetical protein
MDTTFDFVYAFHLNAARLQEEQGILPRELMSCVKKIRAVFTPFIHGRSGSFICSSCKNRKLVVSFAQVGLRVIITDVKLIRSANEQRPPFYRKAA